MTSTRFETAVRSFDALNAADPTTVEEHGVTRPRQLAEAERLSRWIERLSPNAPEPLRLAARCQHLERFKRPRSDYPMDRNGYLLWRKDAARFHGDRAAEVLEQAGYDHGTIARVRAILSKKALKFDADVQVMEDALCLCFLEYDLADFARSHPSDKIEDIIRKTWRKMSETGRARALELSLAPELRAVLSRALGAPDSG